MNNSMMVTRKLVEHEQKTKRWSWVKGNDDTGQIIRKSNPRFVHSTAVHEVRLLGGTLCSFNGRISYCRSKKPIECVRHQTPVAAQ